MTAYQTHTFTCCKDCNSVGACALMGCHIKRKETYYPDTIVHQSPPVEIKASGNVASSILTEAAKIVAGDRNATHGDKERSFQVIADLWNAYLSGKKTKGTIEPVDVAQMMVLLKIGRSIQGVPVRDHFVDAAGYAGIAGELSQ